MFLSDLLLEQLGVSKNNGIPKIIHSKIGFSIIFNHPFLGPTPGTLETPQLLRGFVSIPGGFNAIDDQEVLLVGEFLSDIKIGEKREESVEYDE